AHVDPAGDVGDPLHHPLIHAFVNVEAGTRAAALAGVEEKSGSRARNGGFQGRIGEDGRPGLLPPVTGFLFSKRPADAFPMSLPTSVEPVKAILSTRGCAASGAPAPSPKPVRILTTPGGKPDGSNSSDSRGPDIGVCSATFSTTVHPAANAGASFPAAINSGKFQGMICPTTPIGSRMV